MSRRLDERIADIIQSCEKILRFISGLSKEKFFGQDLVVDAVLRNIEIIGEATKHLPDDVGARMPGIQWKKIAGMRDWISHVYYRVDDEIVWDAVENKIPELLRTLQDFKDNTELES